MLYPLLVCYSANFSFCDRADYKCQAHQSRILSPLVSFTFDRHLKYNSLKIVKMVVIEIFYVIFVYVRKNATAAYYKLVSLHSQIFNNKTNSKLMIL